MNAYELADDIVACTTDALHKKCSDMLRQQADQIEELKRENFALQNTLTNRALRTYDGKLE
jgi:hypothetical protein